MSADWQTPPWLVEKCRTVLGGHISFDPCASPLEYGDTVGAMSKVYRAGDALTQHWVRCARCGIAADYPPTMLCNPPGDRSGKLVRAFWDRFDLFSPGFAAAVWVDFNLDHLRFITTARHDKLVIPRKRIAFVDPATGKERRGAQIGGFLLFRGQTQFLHRTFPADEYLHLWGDA